MLAGRAAVTICALLAVLLVAACATKVGRDGSRTVEVHPRYIAKTDIDRSLDASRREVVYGLRRLTEKLYKRNPREWRKASQPSLEAAVDRLFSGRGGLAELEGRQEGAAAMLAFSADYNGDRVLALVAGLLGMVDAAFEHKDDFYVFDDLDAQKLYNCARNIEIALWKLSSARAADGEPFLLANDLDPRHPNLSFEREFGRLIGVLDLLSGIIADKNGRALSRFTQSVATAVFLPVGALGFR
ncbi:hypothetical protein [Rhodocyclus tenuis]|uniref:hypothetical protein n=1 Tax=Rhodocyclus tenuis TaxID=1066 RepID=UPI0019033A47|nr:hypothetical protein [Rhodocyclus tenuis]MBK1680127.1 hypothetical protein [Rhodocyclus tenuis]